MAKEQANAIVGSAHLPASHLLLSGWCVTSWVETHGVLKALVRPSSYQCALVVPFNIVPVLVSTSNKIDE